MKIYKPEYYDRFRCIAGACPDSCCKEWDVQIDPEAAKFYNELPGALGDRLRQVMRTQDGETTMTIVDGRCPMWREDGLCRIQAELGEAALCQVCRDFPRLCHDYGDFQELGLELSCPEAARILLSAPALPLLEMEAPGGEEPEYDPQAMDDLLATRPIAMKLLNGELPPAQALTLLLVFGYQAQDQLDGGEPELFESKAAMETARSLARPGNAADMAEFFLGLEILTPQWADLLHRVGTPRLPREALALARYFLDRYWLQAVSDYDLVCRVKFTVIACLLIASLPGDFCRNAQLFSKEIENDADNVDAILDAVYVCPAFTDDRLLGVLFGL